MSVELTPASRLGFERPLTRLVPQVLRVHNPHPQPVAFKIKTTAPKQYSVRPNADRVEAGETVKIQIVLQPLKQEPEVGAKSRDKFLVQSVLLSPDRESLDLHDIWASVPGSEVSEQKIRVAWIGDGPADGAGAPDATALAAATSPTSPIGTVAPALSSPTAGAPSNGAIGATAAAAAAGTGAPSDGAGATFASPTIPDASRHSLPPSSAVDATGVTGSRALPPQGQAPSSSLSTGQFDEKKTADTSSPESQIQSLQNQLALAQAERGVPGQTAGLIALLVFVLTYIFF